VTGALEAPVPDPIGDPTAYQQHLLSLLGVDDPAQVQGSTPAVMQSLIEGAGSELTSRPQATEWSALECLAHITDAELVMSGRYRFVLSQDTPPLIGYDQDLWVQRLHGSGDDPLRLLALFRALRSENVALYQASSPQDRERIGMHAERGPESFDLAFRMIAGHDRFHIAQAQRALSSVRGQRWGQS
jgi:DinB superfamily